MDDNLQESLGGYVNYSLTEFPIRVLLNDDNHPFPLASAVSLNFYENENDDEPTNYYFQPYHTNTTCFTGPNTAFNFTNHRVQSSDFYQNGTFPYFSEEAWDRFTDAYDIDPDGAFHQAYRNCLNEDYPCR